MSDNQNNLPENNEVKPHGFSNKKNIIIIALAAVLALGGGITAVGIGAANRAERSVSSGIQLAERYLSELNYTQAVIEFQRVLEIEPMNVDAYLGLAKAYIGLGDTEKALKILRQGLELTGDQRLQAMIDELNKPGASLGDDTSKQEFVSMGSVTILGEEYDIATTTELSLWEKNVSNEDVKQIGKLINLTYLSLGCNEISDIMPLSELTNLNYLDLDGNDQISDITPLAGLTNLTILYLCHNQISDITPLSGLTNLIDLQLDDNQISDITPLAGLANLENLYLWDNQISDITPLAKLINLPSLHLGGNQISNIMPLAGLTNLTSLCLSSNQISNITPLAELINLTELWLDGNQISDIMPLTRHINLTFLYLINTQISDSDKAWLKEQLPNCDISF